MTQSAPPPENLPGVPPSSASEEHKPSAVQETKTSVKAEGEPEGTESKDGMASEPEKEKTPVETAKRDFFILVGIFIFVIVLYVLHGSLSNTPKETSPSAPEQSSEQSENHAPTLSTGGGFFDSLIGSNQIPLPLDTKILSFYHGWVALASGTAGTAIYPGREFVTIQIVKNNLSYLSISGWSLQNSAGERFYLGKADKLPLRGQVNTEDPLIVNAGDTIIVSTGESPIGTSFRQNSCSGYLEQFQDFFPPIENRCPSARPDVNGLQRECQTFVRDIPRCQTVVDFPSGITGQCQSFVAAQTGYNACVREYSNNPEFLGNIWRIYLKQDTEIWKEPHDTITLFDNQGKIVAAIKY